MQNVPEERRDEVRKRLIEAWKETRVRIREMSNATKKLMPHLIKRMPEFTTNDDVGAMMLMGDLENEEFLAYVGIDKVKGKEFREQYQKIKQSVDKMTEKLFKKATASDDPAEIDKLGEELADIFEKVIKDHGEVLGKELTPEQYGKFRELRLINSSTNKDYGVLFDFGQYASLDLTDEQRRKIDEIRVDYTRDFQPLAKKLMEVQEKRMEQWAETGDFKNSEELKKMQEEAEKPIIQLNAATRARVLALLTKEQTAKLERILAGAPKYLARRVGLIKEDEEWKKSWKPGDPIPEGAVPDRPHGIFPMGL